MFDSINIDYLDDISLAALVVWIFSRPWQSIWIDYLKMKCCELRAQLEHTAKEGLVGFNDPAYEMLWRHLEFHIQSKDAIRLVSFIVALIMFWRKQKDLVPLDDAIREVQDVNLQMELMQIYERSIEIQILQAAARSPLLPLLVALAIAVIPIAFLGTWAQKTRRFIVERAKIADTMHTSIGSAPPGSAPPS